MKEVDFGSKWSKVGGSGEYPRRDMNSGGRVYRCF